MFQVREPGSIRIITVKWGGAEALIGTFYFFPI
jgi:hypothetical protein